MTPEPSVAIAPGARLGDLQLVRELGRGNQGLVYEALQISIGRKVAVKILPREISFVPEQLDRFHREAEAAGRLTHPNIVAVYGFDDSHGHPIIVQEMVAGGSLEKVLADRATRKLGTDVAAARWAAETCRQLAEALEHAHRHNVIHRDIKPGNVLLTPEGTPKIADFGLAKVSDLMDLSQTGTIMGTPHYMSPEQVSGRSGLDARTDVYSLGALLYRMLTHEVPFAGDSMQRMFNDILNREPRPPRKLQPGVPPDLEAVCLKALEKSPEGRYASAGAMAEDLSRFVRGETTQARPVGLAGRTLRLMGRQSTLALIVLSLLLPTAWFAADVLLGEKAKAGAPDLHDTRAGLAVLAALLLAWPLFHLATRLAGARAWAGTAAAALVFLLGATGAIAARTQKGAQLHEAARAELAARLDLEQPGTRPDTSDLQDYAARWEPRLDDEDRLLLARGYLKRERPVQAQSWAAQLAGGTSGPVDLALRAAIAAALGRDDEAAAAESGLRAAQAGEQDWRVWERTGDILLDTHRREEARAAYERAAHLPGADRDLLNLELAKVSASLCEWEQADDVLSDVMKWRPNDPRALQLAIAIARQAGDEKVSGGYVERYVASPGVGSVERLDSQMAQFVFFDRQDEADALLRSVRARPDLSAEGLEWCAGAAQTRGRARDLRARVAAATGRPEDEQAEATLAREWFEVARADYAALCALPGDSLIGRIGHAAALLKLLRYHPAEADELRAQAAAHGRRAIELDPYYWQAHYNLGVTLRLQALAAAGNDLAAIPEESWREICDTFTRAVQVNGLQRDVLNDAAHSLTMLHRARPDAVSLAEARDLARRAVARALAARAGKCAFDFESCQKASSCWDTLSEIQELEGDASGALQSAREALDVLDPRDTATRARRSARLEHLTALGEPAPK